MKMLANLLRREALVLTYNDLPLIGSLFVFGLMLLPLVGRPCSLRAMIASLTC